MKSRSNTLCRATVVLLATLAGCDSIQNTESQLKRADAQLAMGHYAAARSDLAAAAEREPQNARVLVALTRAEIGLGNLTASEQYLARANAAGADKAALRSLRVAILFAAGKVDDQLKFLEAQDVSADSAMLAMRGTIFLWQKKFAEAAADLQAARRLAPDNVQVWLPTAQLYVTQGNMVAARAAFQRVVDAAPGATTNAEKIRGLVGLLELHLANNALPEATSVLQRLQDVAPNTVLTRFFRGRLALQSGDAPLAVTELTAVRSIAPNDMAAATLLGAALLAQGSREQATAILAEVVARNPANAYARKLLAQTQLANNEADAARRTLAAGDSETRPDAQADFLMASSLMKLNDISGAVHYLTKAADADPGNPLVLVELARARLMTGDLAGARAAIETIPPMKRDRNAQVLLVMANISGQDGATAARYLEQLVAANLSNLELVAVAGTFALRLGHVVAAGRYFNQVLAKNPNHVTALAGAAQIAIQNANYAAAEKHLLAILDVDKANQPAFLTLASLEQRRGDVVAARGWLERAIAADPTVATARLVLARLEFGTGNAPKANGLLDQAISLASNKVTVTEAAGEIARDAGQFEAAAARFAAAIRLGSKSAPLQLARAQMDQKRPKAARATLASVTAAPYSEPAGIMLVALDVQERQFDAALAQIARLRAGGMSEARALELQGDVNQAAGQRAAAVAAFEKSQGLLPTRGVALKWFQALLAGQARTPEKPLVAWLARQPADTQVRTVLAMHLQQIGKTAEAIRHFELAIAGSPSANAAALNNLAWAYYQVGDQRALATARSAYAGNEANPEIADTYGWLLVESGEVAEGQAILAAVVAKGVVNPSTRYHLAVARSRNKDIATARRDLSTLLASRVAFAEQAEAERLLAALGPP